MRARRRRCPTRAPGSPRRRCASTRSRLPADLRRQLDLLKVSLVLATPSDPTASEEITQIVSRMRGTYGKGKWCPDPAQPDTCHNIDDVTRVLANSRNEPELRREWEGWHTISPPMKKDYARFAELSNNGARELGFADTGAMWRAKYDMPPDAFAKELDRLWEQVRPLYLQLHAYVRMKLRAEVRRRRAGERSDSGAPARQHLGAGLVEHLPARGARQLGRRLLADRHPRARKTMRRSTWSGSASASTRRSASRRCRRRSGQRSLFVRPRDRDVVCHASAWDVDDEADVRIKMCIEQTAEDFSTIHHELGHNFYQRAYKDQPIIFRDSANDGFHEAIGDTIALSVTPEYLVRIGLLDKAPDASSDIGLLMTAGAREGGVPAVRPGDRPVALEGVLRRGQAGSLQRRVVGAAPEVPGRCAGDAARRGLLRSGRQVSRAGQHAVHALLPGGHPAVPVSPRAGAGGRLHDRRCTAARSTRAKRPASGSIPCWRWACRSRGPTRSKR